MPLTYQACSLQVPPDSSVSKVVGEMFVREAVVGGHESAESKQMKTHEILSTARPREEHRDFNYG